MRTKAARTPRFIKLVPMDKAVVEIHNAEATVVVVGATEAAPTPIDAPVAGQGKTETKDDEDGDDERFANVSSAIMLNLPTSKLPGLRVKFEDEEEGLKLYQYLRALIPCMNLRNYSHLVGTVADLVDFFMLVDINGDGFMEWDEFTSFIIEQVVGDRDFTVHEKLMGVGHTFIQSTTTRHVAQASKYVSCFHKMFVGVGNVVQMYGPDCEANTWTNLAFEFELADRDRGAGDDDPISVLDLVYLECKDMLIISRSDLCIELMQFMSRSSLTEEMIDNVGLVTMDIAYDRIEVVQLHKEKPRLFAIGANFAVATWQMQAGAGGKWELINNLQLTEHTDYVRDILVVNTEDFQYFVSGGMDQKIHIYDLETLRHRTIRTGFTAGVQCLAFDGKSVLLGGGFDYQILGWDLDQSIDRPLFKLLGHAAPICRIVAFGSQERAFSLDTSGVLRIWDTTRQNPIDGLERIIDNTSITEDPVKSFDVFHKLGPKFSTVHGFMVCGHGKKQHTFRLQDTTQIASAPMKVLFSYNLMLVISIHAKDIMFWNASLGCLNSRKDNLAGTGEMTSATLDDRNRKAICGDSRGKIEIYNCLSGAHLKTLDVSQSAIRHMIYSPDKIIIAISGEGDLLAIDEFPRGGSDVQVNLRETRAHDADVVSLAYSHEMGLVATVDCTGTLMVWDYQYWIVQYMLHNCTGGLADACEISFLDPLPLLLISDSQCGFTIIPIGPAMGRGHAKIYRVDSAPLMMQTRVAGELDEMSLGEGSIGSASTSGTKSSKGKSKGLNYHGMRKYVAVPHEPKSMMVLMEELDSDDMDSLAGGPSGLQDDGSVESSSNLLPTLSENEIPTPVQPFPSNLSVKVVCGQDDGTVAVYDLTPALKDINEGYVNEKDYAYKQHNYDPRRRTRKAVRVAEIEAATIEPDEADARSVHVSCTMQAAWDAHSGTVNDVKLIGDFRNIITVGDDSAIFLWSMDGCMLGVLTRGRDLDKVLKPFWKNPVDMDTKNLQRRSHAGVLIDKLLLRPDTYAGQKVKQLYDSDDDKKAPEVVYEMRYTEKRLPDIIREGETAKDVDERVRVVEQMRGKITYTQSAKELAMGELAEKHASVLQAIRDIGAPKKKKKKKQTSLAESSTNEDDMYLESVNMPTDHVYNATTVFIPKKSSTENNSAIAQELADIEANDPHNWSITSTNRQRQLYRHMFRELEKAGMSEIDPMQIIGAKLNTFSPGGDFEAYFAQLLAEKKAARLKAKENKKLAEELAQKARETAELKSVDADGNLVPLPPPLAMSVEVTIKTRTLADPHPMKVRDLKADRSLDASWNDSLRYAFYRAPPVKKAPSSAVPLNTAVEEAQEKWSHHYDSGLADDTLDSASIDPTLKSILSAPNLYAAMDKEEKQKRMKAVLSNPEMKTANNESGGSRLPPPLREVLSPTRPKAGGRSWDRDKDLRAENKQLKNELVLKFESRLNLTEKAYRKAEKVNRRAAQNDRKKLRRNNGLPQASDDDRSVGTISVVSDQDAHTLSSLSTALLPLAPVRRHVAGSMLARSRSKDLALHSLDGNPEEIMQMKTVIKKKTAEAERRWVRKVRNALGSGISRSANALDFASDSRGPVYVITAALQSFVETNDAEESVGAKKEHVQLVEYEAVKKKHEHMKSRINIKKTFGEYNKKELLRFWKIWMKLDLVRKDGAGDDDSSSLGIMHFSEGDEPMVPTPLDTLLQQIRREETALNVMANYDSVLLEDMQAHPFCKSVPSFKSGMEEVVRNSIADNIPVPTVRLSLNECVTYLCPFMSASERMEAIRMYSMQPKIVKGEEKSIKNVQEEDIARMRIMFDYMDADHSGYVDKDEIVASLINDSEAIQEEIDKAEEDRFLMGEETEKEPAPAFVWTEDKIIEMVSAVDADGNLELDFEEFLGLFSNFM